MKLSEFGKALRKMRLERELTLTSVAEALGCSVAYLSAVERGARKPTKKLITALEELLALDNGQRRDFNIAAQQSRHELIIDQMRNEDSALFAIFAHQISSMDGDQTALLERVIGDEATFKLVMKLAQQVIDEQDRRKSDQLNFNIQFVSNNNKTKVLKRNFSPHYGRCVPPLSKDEIIRKVLPVRRAAKATSDDIFDVILFLDRDLGRACPGYDYRVVEDELFIAHLIAKKWQGSDVACVQAYADPFFKEIVIRQSVFEKACDLIYSAEAAEARFTIAHEIAHAILHTDVSDYAERCEDQVIFVDSEWQADVGARHILLSRNAVQDFNNAQNMARQLFVSQKCAHQHWSAYANGIVDRRQITFDLAPSG